MNPYRHEFAALLRRNSILGVAIVAVLAGSLGYVSVSGTSLGVSAGGFWVYSGGSYHLELWTYDDAGLSLPGIVVDLLVEEVSTPSNVSSTPAPSPPPIPKVVYSASASSRGDGSARFDFDLPTAPNGTGFSASLSGEYPSFPTVTFGGVFANPFPLSNSSHDTAQPIDSPFNEVAQGFYSAQDRYLVVWAGPGGAAPSGDAVVACTVPFFDGGGPVYLPDTGSNCTGARASQRLGALTGYTTFLPLPTLPTVLANGSELVEYVEIVNASGDPVYVSSSGATCFVGQCAPGIGEFGQATPGPELLSIYATELSLVLPLMALLLGYWSYAKPRLDGTLEPVLSRPVTRSGLFLVRYGTVSLALLAASIGEVLLLDAGLSGFLREPLPSAMILPLAFGYAVATIGFAGLIFLMAHIFRSSGPVLGLGIGFLVALSLLWEEIVGGIAALAHIPTYGSAAYETLLLRSQLFALPQIPYAVTGNLTNSTFRLSETILVTYPSAGVTFPVIAAVSAAWIVVPFLVAYYLASRRD